MAHALLSINKIVTEVNQPHKAALIHKAAERGIMYKLKCVNPKGLKTRWDRVDRSFAPNEEKLLTAHVAAALIQLYNIDMVGGSSTHPGGGKGSDTPAPFMEPNFVEIVDDTRTDLGPMITLVRGGRTLNAEVLQEANTQYERPAGQRIGSDEVSAADVAALGGKPTPTEPTEV